MASIPLNGPAAPVTLPGVLPPMPAVARILSRFDRDQLAGFIAVAIDLADALDGPADPDNPDFAPLGDGKPGDPDDHECSGDEEAAAWIEWSTMRGAQKTGHNIAAGEEDDEEDDAAEEDDPGEEDDPAGVVDEDGTNTITQRGYLGLPIGTGPGCTIADDDGHGLHGDVPTLPVYALDPNIFTGERQFLGLSNLLTSYRTNGQTLRSADSGRDFQSHATPPQIGTPV